MCHQAGSSNCCWIEHSKVWHLCVPAAVTHSREASIEGCSILSSRDGFSALQWWDVHASVFQQGRHPQSCQGREIAECSWSQYSWQAPVTAVWCTQVSEHQITSLSWKEASLGTLCMQLDCNLHYMETVLTSRSNVLRVWSSLHALFSVEMGWQCGVSKIFMFWQLGNKRTFYGRGGGEGKVQMIRDMSFYMDNDLNNFISIFLKFSSKLQKRYHALFSIKFSKNCLILKL